MRKLLILLSVFGIASGANAGTLSLEVYVDGSPYTEGTPISVGAAVDVYIVQDAEDTLGSGGEVWVNFEGDLPLALDLTELSIVDFYGGWDWLMNAGVAIFPANDRDPGATGWDFWMGKVANPGVGTPGLGSLMGLTGIPGQETYTVQNSTAMFSFTVAEDVPTIEFVQGHWDGVFPGEPPEPMTIALLGLGGLFLRCRKLRRS